jgi:hypothetical protein
VNEDGSCPVCASAIDSHDVSGRVTAKNLDLKALAKNGGEDVGAPWHFKLLVAMLIAYLGWRVVDLFR